jgi:cytochrome P450
MTDERSFPLGATVTLEQLEQDPHSVLARLRTEEPVSWLPALGGWLVTRYDLALEVMRDSRTFTVADPRFSTAQVIGQSMLSTDGQEHSRHREPFTASFRPGTVRSRFSDTAARRAERLIDGMAPAGGAELRRAFAGPFAAVVLTTALGLPEAEVGAVLSWYDSIVAAVTSITAGEGVTPAGRRGFAALKDRLGRVVEGGEESSLLVAVAAASQLTGAQIVSNAAVLLFGGIETTEGMICNALLHLLQHPDQLVQAGRDPASLHAAIEESLRLEPAAALIDRYVTAPVQLGDASIRRGELVRVSIAGANRDPAVFAEPDRFIPGRARVRGHLAFAQGPHVCLGVHLAHLETQIALSSLMARFPRLRLDPDNPAAVRGLVFRKPPALHVLWS